MRIPCLALALAAMAMAGPTARSQTASEQQDALALQVMLDRAGFSPGVVDGRMGPNTERAHAAFREQGGTDEPAAGAVTRYVITADDAAGPFVPTIPDDMMLKAKLPSLGYRDVVERLSERFHSTPALLRQLNPDARFEAGEAIRVPNVEPLSTAVPGIDRAPQTSEAAVGTSGSRGQQPTGPDTPDVTVIVSKSTSTLTVRDASGRTIFYAPVTTGSEHDPLPLGDWKVTGVQLHPQFRYNPELFWDADPAHSKATIPAGPNNPVGLVWIDLSREHYGIHGTAEPDQIGRSASHGCVRMTNWDAMKLASMVKRGTRVLFTE